jgi:hypothetical protein
MKFTAEGMAFTRGEVAERHFERAADCRLHVMHGAGKAVGRKPLGERVRLDECAIDLLRASCQDAVQAYGIRHGYHPYELTNWTTLGRATFQQSDIGPIFFRNKLRQALRARILDEIRFVRQRPSGIMPSAEDELCIE